MSYDFLAALEESSVMKILKETIESEVHNILKNEKRVCINLPYIFNDRCGLLVNPQLQYHTVRCVDDYFYPESEVLFFGENFDHCGLRYLGGKLGAAHDEKELEGFGAFIFLDFVTGKDSKRYKNQQMIIEHAIKKDKNIIFLNRAFSIIENATKITRGVIADVCKDIVVLPIQSAPNFESEMIELYKESREGKDTNE